MSASYSVAAALDQLNINDALVAYQRQLPLPKARHLLRMMVQRDPLLAWYGGQVAYVCARLGDAAGLSAQQNQDLLTAAALHDVGRLIARPRRTGTPDEHATLGEWLCLAAGLSPEVQRAVRHHHERMDGTGSPDGLAGCAIPLPARIIAVADAYVDLAASSLCGVGPILPDVRSKLLRLRGSTLDPDLVGLFLKRCSGPLK